MSVMVMRTPFVLASAVASVAGPAVVAALPVGVESAELVEPALVVALAASPFVGAVPASVASPVSTPEPPQPVHPITITASRGNILVERFIMSPVREKCGKVRRRRRVVESRMELEPVTSQRAMWGFSSRFDSIGGNAILARPPSSRPPAAMTGP